MSSQIAADLEITGSDQAILIGVAVIAVIALVIAFVLRAGVLAAGKGTPKMQEISEAVQEGAAAYLGRQFRTLGVFVAIVFVLLFALPAETMSERIGRSIAFLFGAAFSAAIGYFGMWLATRANVRVAAAANGDGGREKAMQIAFRTGGAVGLATTGLGLLGASVVVLAYSGGAPKVLEGFGFGAAMLAMFMRVGGGIFTKAADVGADLVGKVEQGIPEDDPRNAATIADNVGDNVGDCAGMAADLFESYAVTLVASLILGSAAFGAKGLVFPLIIPTIGVITAIIGIYITKARANEAGLVTINRSFYISAVISAVLSAVAAFVYLPSNFRELNVPAVADVTGNPAVIAISAVVIGIVLAAVILWLTGYFTDTNNKPTKDVAKSSLTGAATVILAGISVGFESAVYTALVIAGAVYGAFLLSGSLIVSLFMIALAGCGLLTTVGVIVAMDTFGPVSDNAQGVAEMSGEVSEEGAKILTELDAVGNTTKAITKGIAIATAVLAATALFGSYSDAIATALVAAGRTGQRVHRQRRLAQHAGRHVARRVRGLPVLRARGQRGRQGRRRGRHGGPPAVPGDPRNHGGHQQAGVRQGRRHRHPRFAARAGHPGPAGRLRADRRRLRSRRRPAGRLPGRHHRHRHPDGRLPGQLRWLVGQREEDRRGRHPRRQGLARPRGHHHR